MIHDFILNPISSKSIAKSVHTNLLSNGVSHYELGVFYKSMLAQRLWPSRTSLAESFGVSLSKVARLVAMAEIPADVVKAFGDPRRVSFRIADLLLETMDKLGIAIVEERAREVSTFEYRSVEDVLEYLVTNRISQRSQPRVSVRLARNKKSLRVDISDLDRFIPHLPKVEQLISRAFVIFESTLHDEVTRQLRKTPRKFSL